MEMSSHWWVPSKDYWLSNCFGFGFFCRKPSEHILKNEYHCEIRGLYSNEKLIFGLSVAWLRLDGVRRCIEMRTPPTPTPALTRQWVYCVWAMVNETRQRVNKVTLEIYPYRKWERQFPKKPSFHPPRRDMWKENKRSCDADTTLTPPVFS